MMSRKAPFRKGVPFGNVGATCDNGSTTKATPRGASTPCARGLAELDRSSTDASILPPERPTQLPEPYYSDDLVTLYHGDCRDVLPSLAASSVDLVLTDPPYGIAYRSGRGSHGPIAGDDGSLDVLASMRLALTTLRFNRHFYIFGPYDAAVLTQGATAELIWDKGKHGSGNLTIPWGKSHEPISFGVWTPYASQKGSGAQVARLRRGSVLRFPTTSNGRGAKDHPTEKPIPLLRELIESSSRIGELVLDPFAGCGSTLAAAKVEGRRSIGVELDEAYCEIAAKRLSQDTLFGGVA